MHLIETHAHLDDPRFEHDLDEVIARAAAVGVDRIVTIGTGIKSNRAALVLAERYPSVYAAVGIHPANVHEEGMDWSEELRALAAHPKVVALGEIGLDYYHLPDDTSSSSLEKWRDDQIIAFQKQLELALELGLNVIIHQRDYSLVKKNEESSSNVVVHFNAWEDILKILTPYTKKIRAVFHCFGGTSEQAAKLATLGHLVSFTGIITFKNAPIVRETAQNLAPDHYMVETDCPYLAPVPHRGERAEPAHVRLVAEKIAEVRGISLEEVARATTETAENFFRFSKRL